MIGYYRSSLAAHEGAKMAHAMTGIETRNFPLHETCLKITEWVKNFFCGCCSATYQPLNSVGSEHPRPPIVVMSAMIQSQK